MLKKLMTATALTGLLVGSALAEGAPSSSPSPAPKTEVTKPAPAPKAEATTPAPAPKAAANMPAAGATSAKFVNSQTPDQYLASKFKGTDVIGTDNQKIGDVSDILFDKDGKVLAYVVGVGGFLGIGTKDVAIEPSSFKVVPGDKSKNESDKLQLSMSKDQLKQAANFEPYKPPRVTTGAGGAGGMAGRPASPK